MRLRSLNPCLYAGNFNCRQIDWCYDSNSPNVQYLVGWANINGLTLLCDAEDAASSYSSRWSTGTNLVLRVAYRIDMSLKSSLGHNIDLRLLHYLGLLCHY